jgi:hypothetical protein
MLLLGLMPAACASSDRPTVQPAAGAADGATNANSDPLEASWDGTTLAVCGVNTYPSRCNAQQKVKITLLRNDNGRVTGYYACSYGNQTCFRQNTTGKVTQATLSGNQLFIRVSCPDGTGMIFQGRVVNGDQISGGYTATTGGSVIESGIWRAARAY